MLCLNRSLSYTDIHFSKHSEYTLKILALYFFGKFTSKEKVNNDCTLVNDSMLKYLREIVQMSVIYLEMCKKIGELMDRKINI